jgi:hypothetical protein
MQGIGEKERVGEGDEEGMMVIFATFLDTRVLDLDLPTWI